jgi:hypothetical protein
MFPGMLGKFSALKTPGCAFYYEADGKKTLDGSSNASSWGDMSGNARDVTQGTAGNRPPYIASGINGRPAFNFKPDATGRILTLTNNSLTRNIGNLTVVLVYQHSATVTGYDGVFSINASTGERAAFYRPSGSTRGVCYGRRLDEDAANSADWATDAYNASAHVVIAEFDWANSAAYVWLDGVLVVSDSTWAGTDGNTSDTNAATIYIGGMSAGASFNGLVSVIAGWQRSLATVERQRLIQGYGNKYGVPVTVT